MSSAGNKKSSSVRRAASANSLGILRKVQPKYRDIKARCGHEVRSTGRNLQTISLSRGKGLSKEFTDLRKLYNPTRLFVDTEFSMDGIACKRPFEICSDPVLEADCINLDWSLSRLGYFSLYPYMAKVLPRGQTFNAPNYGGLFLIKLFHNARWHDVIIDDSLPYDNALAKLVHQDCTNRSQFWAPLIEKAMAKICGSYEKLANLNDIDFVQMLYGGFRHTITIDNEIIPFTLQETMQNALIKDEILFTDTKLVINVADFSTKNTKKITILHDSLMDCIQTSLVEELETASVRQFANIVTKDYTFTLNGNYLEYCYRLWSSPEAKIVEKSSMSEIERNASGFFSLLPGRYTMFNGRNMIYVRFKRQQTGLKEEAISEIRLRATQTVSFSKFLSESEVASVHSKIVSYNSEWKTEHAQAGGHSRNDSRIHYGLASNPQFPFTLPDGPTDLEYRIRIHLYKYKRYNNFGTGFCIYRTNGAVPANILTREYIKINAPAVITNTNVDINQVVFQNERELPGNYVIIPFARPDDEAHFTIRIEYCPYETQIAKKLEKREVLGSGTRTLF